MLAASIPQSFAAMQRRSRGRTGSSWADEEQAHLDRTTVMKNAPSDDDASTAVDDRSSKHWSDSSEDGVCPRPSSEEATRSPTAAAMMPMAFMPQPAGGFQTMMAPMAGGAAVAPQFYMMSVAPNGQQMLVPVMAGGGVPFCGMQVMQMPQAQAPAPEAEQAGDLEGRARALSAQAEEASAAARRAKAAVQHARQAGRAPTQSTMEEATKESRGSDRRTTLMLRNLPNTHSRSLVSDLLDKHGFYGTYCFIYVPTDFKKLTSFGYAFVGFSSHDSAVRAKRFFHGFGDWAFNTVCDVAWSGPVQGLEQHTERYRNSPVMHPSVPDEYKPAVYVNGVRAPFPAPSKRIRPPRMRHSIAGELLDGDLQAA